MQELVQEAVADPLRLSPMEDSDEVLRLKKYVRVLSLINPQMKQKESDFASEKAVLSQQIEILRLELLETKNERS